MIIEETTLKDVLAVTPKRFGDDRGFFSETFNRKAWADAGLDYDFVQDNHSKSSDAGTIRGLHYQSPPSAQDKLVRVISGSILDVAVDVRVGSPTYAKWVAVELSADNGKQLFIPKGFLHGFLTLVDAAEVVYKCTDFYAPECDGSIRYDDPSIGIDWDWDTNEVILSEKDANAPSFDAFESPFTYEAP